MSIRLFPAKSLSGRRRRGVTLVEVMVASFVSVLLFAMIIPATIFFGRAIKAQRFQQNAQQQAIQAMRIVENTMIAAASITINQLNSNEVIMTLPYARYETVNGNLVFTQFLRRVTLTFVDEDGDPNTIADNRVIWRVIDFDPSVSGPNSVLSETERVLLTHVSPLRDANGNNEPIFRFRPITDTGAFRGFVEMRARIGDRTNPANRSADPMAIQDDAITGIGYQGFTFSLVLTPNNVNARL